MLHRHYGCWQGKKIQQALQNRRVLLLAGAQQCGKITLAMHLAKSNSTYRTLDDITLLDAALSDPQGFVRHGDNLMIIDEVQCTPI